MASIMQKCRLRSHDLLVCNINTDTLPGNECLLRSNDVDVVSDKEITTKCFWKATHWWHQVSRLAVVTTYVRESVDVTTHKTE